MKTVFAILALSLLAPNVMAQPVKLRLFTAPDDAGFVTAESKQRQYILKEVTKKLSKEAKKEILLSDDAAVTIEIIAIENKGTGTSETHTSGLGVALHTPELKETTQIRETSVRALLKFEGFEKELVSVHRNGELGNDEILFTNLVKAFVKDNAAKLK